jgi:hypothetical protein
MLNYDWISASTTMYKTAKIDCESKLYSPARAGKQGPIASSLYYTNYGFFLGPSPAVKLSKTLIRINLQHLAPVVNVGGGGRESNRRA